MKLDKNTITDTTQEKIYRQTETYRNRLRERQTDTEAKRDKQTDKLAVKKTDVQRRTEGWTHKL